MMSTIPSPRKTQSSYNASYCLQIYDPLAYIGLISNISRLVNIEKHVRLWLVSQLKGKNADLVIIQVVRQTTYKELVSRIWHHCGHHTCIMFKDGSKNIKSDDYRSWLCGEFYEY